MRKLEEAKDTLAETLATGVLTSLEETGAFVDFYGAVNNQFKIGFDDALISFEVIEDENDGYRSSLGTICIRQEHEEIFFRTPIARVMLVKDPQHYEMDGYLAREQDTRSLIDSDGHVWLKFGTDNSDDYYPSFVFDYSPKLSKGN